MTYKHEPHPWIALRKLTGPPKTTDVLPKDTPYQRFGSKVGLKITVMVGTFTCALVFTVIALFSLPSAFSSGSIIVIVAWIAQTFLQLVLLSIILLGQNIQAAASDFRAESTYKDAEAVLHTALQIQDHLKEQDEEISRILVQLGVKTAPEPSPEIAITSLVSGRPADPIPPS